MKKLLPFMLVFVVLSSGCTIPVLNIEIPGLPEIPGFGGPTVVQYEHDIVIMTSLEAVPNEIDAGQSAKLITYVNNKGDKPVENVVVELYDYCSGLFTPEITTCRDNKAGPTKCEIKKLLAGQTIPVVWTLKQEGEVKLKTICPPDGMKVLVKYPYKTSSLTTISFISETELQRSLEERTYKTTASYIVTGQGPIKPYITVEDKQPVPVFKGARTVLALQVSNKGTGQLASEASKDNTKIIAIPRANVKITNLDSGGELKPADDCPFKSGSPDDDVRLIGKDSSKMICKVDISSLDGKVTKTTTKHVEVSVEYEYIFTKSVPITVNPKVTG
jgi:hypothetical protein